MVNLFLLGWDIQEIADYFERPYLLTYRQFHRALRRLGRLLG